VFVLYLVFVLSTLAVLAAAVAIYVRIRRQMREHASGEQPGHDSGIEREHRA
jgi:hypothetical protein